MDGTETSFWQIVSGLRPDTSLASLLAVVRPRKAGREASDPAVLTAAPTVLAFTDAHGLVRFVTPNAALVLGEACDRAPALGIDLIELVQPEHPAEVTGLLARLGNTEAGGEQRLDVLTRAPDGGERWLELHGINHLTRMGAAGFLFEIRDVTESRKDRELQAVVAAALNHAAASIFVTDPAGRILFVNPVFEEQTGYSAAEVVGCPASLLKSGNHEDEEYARIWRALSGGQRWQGEIINRRKSGELYTEELQITPVPGGDGRVALYVACGRDITARKRREAQAEDRAFFDPLTGIATPRLLKERSKQILALTRRHGHTAALLHVDIDGLHAINDHYGRGIGDEVLRRVAERLRQGLRESDTLARRGSDEFLVLLSDVETEDATARVVRRLRESIGKPFKIQEHTVTVSASFGVALFPGDATTYDELLEYAELAVRRSHTTGTRVEFFRRELTELTNERLSLEDDMRWAWERKQFVLHYQPIMALATGDMVGAEALTRGSMIGIEALARWPHLERGMIEPAHFIPLAERTGRIVALDRWAIATAARQAAAWSQLGWNGWVSVNLSARSLHDLDLADYFAGCMDQHQVPHGRIVLEVTESAAMRDVALTARVLRQLKEAGALIALDDFGMGHSSLAYLKHFPVDILKLDQSFIQDIGLHPKFEHLIEIVINLAHRIDARIVAEGVEELRQLEWLREAGCDYVQGFLVARPQPPDQVEPLSNLGTML